MEKIVAKDIVSMLPEELEAEFAALGEPKFRAAQVFEWIRRGVRDFDKMSTAGGAGMTAVSLLTGWDSCEDGLGEYRQRDEAKRN